MAKTKKKTAKTRRKKKTATKKKAAKAPAKRKRAKSLSKAVRPSSSGSVTRTDPLMSAYMREVNKYPLLSREEERELALKVYENQDRDAVQQLVTSNLRFVVKIAYEYVNYRMRLLDLVQEGNVGLVKAVQEFNPYKNVRLTTYAVWWIRSYIQDAILKNYSLVKMGTTRAQKKLFYRLRAEQAKLEREGLVPNRNVKLLASRLDVREKDVTDMDQRLSGRDMSLNAPVGEDERSSHIENLESDASSADDEMSGQQQAVAFKQILEEFGQSLEGREKVFFDDRLIAEKPLTLQELGTRFGVSKERARQIEEGIKKKIRVFVQEKYPEYDLSNR